MHRARNPELLLDSWVPNLAGDFFSPAPGIFFPDPFCFPSPASILPLPFHAACYLQQFGAGTFHFACYSSILELNRPCCMLFAAFWRWNCLFCMLFAAFGRRNLLFIMLFAAFARRGQGPFSLRAIRRIWELEPSMLLYLLLRLLLLCLLLCCLLL